MGLRGYNVGHFRRTAGEDVRLEQPILATFKRLWGFTWAHRGPLVFAGTCILLISLLNLVIPQVTRVTIDTIIPEQQFDRIAFIAFVILGTGAIIGILTFARSYLMSVVGQRVIFDLRHSLYSHIQSLSMSFFDSRRTGDLMSRVTNDINSLQQLVTSGVMEIFTDALTFIVIMVILFYTDWQLTLLLLITFPLMIITTQVFGTRIRGAYRDVQEQMAHVNEHLQETITSIRLVQSFANEKYEVNRFNKWNRRSMEANINAVKLWSIFFPLIDIMNRLGHVVIIGFGARQVMLGHLSIGTLVSFLAYLQLLHQPVRRFSRVMNTIQQAAASGERIFEIIDTQPEVVEKPGAIDLPTVKGHIHFDDVTFSYETDETVLKNVSLSVEPGQTVALVGPSGAGKTTITNLLTRFYDPDEGRVTVDGYDLRDVTFESLRGQMGIVSQEILLLHGSVRENIAYGKPGASDEEIEEAARIANAHEFISEFPKGYNTVIGERGMKLSGGQRQRLAIARAVLKDPRILILDEATSQLDSESEHLIQQALERLLKQRTSVVVAHRLSTIRNADMIVVLDGGHIVEKGAHDELLALNGQYAALHQRQFSNAVSEVG